MSFHSKTAPNVPRQAKSQQKEKQTLIDAIANVCGEGNPSIYQNLRVHHRRANRNIFSGIAQLPVCLRTDMEPLQRKPDEFESACVRSPFD